MPEKNAYLHCSQWDFLGQLLHKLCYNNLLKLHQQLFTRLKDIQVHFNSCTEKMNLEI